MIKNAHNSSSWLLLNVLPCSALLCSALPCPALPCSALSSPVLPCRMPTAHTYSSAAARIHCIFRGVGWLIQPAAGWPTFGGASCWDLCQVVICSVTENFRKGLMLFLIIYYYLKTKYHVIFHEVSYVIETWIERLRVCLLQFNVCTVSLIFYFF